MFSIPFLFEGVRNQGGDSKHIDVPPWWGNGIFRSKEKVTEIRVEEIPS